MGTASLSAVALAARLHSTDGGRRDDDDALRLLVGAAQAFGAAHPDTLLASSHAPGDGALVLRLRRGSALPDAMLALAASLRPHRPTFCAAIVRHATDARQGVAAERAVLGLARTDARGPRAIMLVPDEDDVLSSLLDLILEAHDGMTDRQRQVVALVRGSGSQQAVARHLNVSRQAVNQSLAAAGWPHISRAESAARASVALAAGETPEDRER